MRLFDSRGAVLAWQKKKEEGDRLIMISYVKAFCALAVIPVLAVAFLGCSGFSDQDANDRCKQEQVARGSSCFTNASFTSCVTAYEDCGDSVTSDSTACPLVYSCPD